MAEFRLELERHVRQLISATLGAARAAQLGELPRAFGTDGSLAPTQGSFQERQTFERVNSQPYLGRTKGRRFQRLRTLLRAVEWQIQLETGAIASRAQIARREGMSRAAVTLAMRSLGSLAGDKRSGFDESSGQPRSHDGLAHQSSDRVPAYREQRRAVLRRFETEHVSNLLHAARGNVSLAANMAGIDRKHFWRLMKRNGVRQSSSR